MTTTTQQKTGLPKGIRVRGTSFMVDVTVRGNRETGTANTLPEAMRLRDTLKASIEARLRGDDPLASPGLPWSFKYAIDRARRIAWDDKASGAKLVRNAEMAQEFFGGMTLLDDISCDCIDAFVEHLQSQGNANGTINRKLAAVSKLFTVAFKRGGCKAKPHFERRKEGVGRIRFLTGVEETTGLSILGQWGYEEHCEAFIVLIDTGLRPNEMWKFETRDCNFEADPGILSAWETKAELPRSVPMTTRVRDILKRRADLTPTGPLFPYNNSWFEKVWNKMKTHMGLDHDNQFIPYALRHTCASRLIQRRVPLKVVQEWLGHKDIKTTLRYAHLCPHNLIDAVKVLEG